MNIHQLAVGTLSAVAGISMCVAADVAPAKGKIVTKAELKAAANKQIKHISSVDLKKAKDSGSVLLLVDIRTKAEYLAGHIEGATWIPRGKLEFKIIKRTLDPNAKIILYCRTGSRGALATLSLQKMGYKNVFNLDGGFAGWTDEGYPFFNMHGEMKMVEYEKKEKKGIEPPKLKK